MPSSMNTLAPPGCSFRKRVTSKTLASMITHCACACMSALGASDVNIRHSRGSLLCCAVMPSGVLAYGRIYARSNSPGRLPRA